MKRLFISCFVMMGFLSACANKNCREIKQEEQAQQATPPLKDTAMDNKSPIIDRIKVYKPDGSLQCGQGKKIPLEKMETELAGIPVYSRYNKNDGLMRIQVCGSPTGNSNVYEIDRKNLEAATKAGFKQWTHD